MVRRFRMIAGPNGSGKSTLVRRLRDDYSVNFYDFLNADDIIESVRQTGAYLPRFPLGQDELTDYAERSTYDDSVKDAIPVLSRAYFFDNSGPQMIYLGQYSREGGFEFSVAADRLPRWFRSLDLQG